MVKVRRWLAFSVLALGMTLVATFGLRAWSQWQFQNRVARGEIQVETLRGWMTLPYIARAYGIPESELRAALGVAASGGENRSLRNWLKSASVEPLVARRAIEALIVARGRPASEPTR